MLSARRVKRVEGKQQATSARVCVRTGSDLMASAFKADGQLIVLWLLKSSLCESVQRQLLATHSVLGSHPECADAPATPHPSTIYSIIVFPSHSAWPARRPLVCDCRNRRRERMSVRARLINGRVVRPATSECPCLGSRLWALGKSSQKSDFIYASKDRNDFRMTDLCKSMIMNFSFFPLPSGVRIRTASFDAALKCNFRSPQWTK